MSGLSVRFDGVSKRYGEVVALDRIDMALSQGERVALIGHNGAGKSTLIKLALGLIRSTAGRIEVMGADVRRSNFDAVRKAIGFLPENVVFPAAITGAEALSFYARLKGGSERRNADLFERTGLAGAAHRRIGTYSKGMRQRLGLAQALIGQPKLLLLDEPTSGLDPQLREEVYNIMSELARNGAAILLSSHALAEIENRTDRIVALNRGRKIADGSLVDLRRISQIPTCIRIRMPEGPPCRSTALSTLGEYKFLTDGTVEFRCEEATKVDVLRRLFAASLPLTDLEVVSPTLSEIYAVMMQREAVA
ncbi:ABC transporter ATP-binding protein [Bradyrhizobium canariense]|uniref:Cu-processing system ATP-binding protein n=1 Tax=Bradyrhizobium canariense TaxID=255045 RepID=A0A1H2BGF0_9BRAD|nr:ABC transporter ATP-binding protein [Bradyrhizobium canariense]SDT57157.1 Cu-processing system ATP-binding protein [Bradyrhizobium canariense]